MKIFFIIYYFLLIYLIYFIRIDLQILISGAGDFIIYSGNLLFWGICNNNLNFSLNRILNCKSLMRSFLSFLKLVIYYYYYFSLYVIEVILHFKCLLLFICYRNPLFSKVIFLNLYSIVNNVNNGIFK